jgi:hypothetical protein
MSPRAKTNTRCNDKIPTLPLTEANLIKLNEPTRSKSTCSETSVQTDANATLSKQTTTTPSPPQESTVAREQARSARTVENDHEPHQCPLGVLCTRDVPELYYHKVKAMNLVAKALSLKLPIQAIGDYDYDRLDNLKNFWKTAMEMMYREQRDSQQIDASQELDPMNTLKLIRQPDYWEAEERYLKNPGCLAERLSVSSSKSSDDTLPKASTTQRQSRTKLGQLHQTIKNDHLQGIHLGDPNSSFQPRIRIPLSLKSSIAEFVKNNPRFQKSRKRRYSEMVNGDKNATGEVNYKSRSRRTENLPSTVKNNSSVLKGPSRRQSRS